LANRQFKRIWLVGLIAAVGDQIFPICATVILLNQGSGASEIAILMSARVIALLTLAPIGGVWADRLSRKLVIVSGAIIRSTLCFLVFLAGEGQSLYLLAGLVFLMGASEAFSGPAGGAIIPSVVDRDLLQSANALKAMSGRFASQVRE
jgi:MFS family permease